MKLLLQTPDEIRQQIWKELSRATNDRHHAWRTPVLATSRTDGSVNARTVVLRTANPIEGQLQIFTDARSPKVAEIADASNAVFVFWSPRLSWQLRVRVTSSVLTAGPTIDALWQRVKQSASARDYLSISPPGSLLRSVSSDSSDSQTPPDTILNKSHFALLTMQVIEMDWLELASTGHRRAKITANTWEWLTP